MEFSIEKGKILSQIKSRIYIAVSAVAIFVFLFFSYSILSGPAPTKEDLSNYSELIRNPYRKYEKYLKRESIRELRNNPQFIEMEHNKDLIQVGEIRERENPFVRSF
jgi:hypothetical protein